MPYHLIPVPFVLIATVLYLQARRRNALDRVRIIQPVGSTLILLVAVLSLLSPRANPTLIAWVAVGLLFSIVGDINNIDMEDPRTVLVGLVIFVFAYVAYAVGLTVVNGFHRGDIVVGGVLLLCYVLMLRYLWSGLGDMKIPVIIYALVLPVLVWRAASTFFGDVFTTTQSALVTTGAASLYVGDLEYGIHRFRRPDMPTTFGPALYLGGQLLIALSLS